ncbi:Molybdenum cofactor biosynthesis protein C [Hyaloraphidium curvatum]|nr:Molybdenum cofactor biosynthesis protein C [Hyaloraphidium curvatum]
MRAAAAAAVRSALGGVRAGALRTARRGLAAHAAAAQSGDARAADAPAPPPPSARERARSRIAAIDRRNGFAAGGAPRTADPLPAHAAALPVLTDLHARHHTYLRLSLTERCNLRCRYCMPADGVDLTPGADLLSPDETERIAKVFVEEGVRKIRLTGGEPSVRKDLVEIVARLSGLRRHGLQHIAMTTNGIALHRKLPDLRAAGLDSINLSLDTLIEDKFEVITRRKGFRNVLASLHAALDLGYAPVKLNVVLMRGINHLEIPSFAALTRDLPVSVRFIEYMPFASNGWAEAGMFPYREALDLLRASYPDLERAEDAVDDTTKHWRVPGHAGTVGFITSMTDDFCSTCTRLRLTADGNLKVCLHGKTEVSLRDVLRAGGSDDEVRGVVSAAVKRKHAKHAGMRALGERSGENRPMILIGGAAGGRGSIRWAPVPISMPAGAAAGLRAYSTSRISGPDDPAEPTLTHLTASGEVHMVDVSAKPATVRRAVARCRILLSPAAHALVKSGNAKKGDVVAVAKIAGIMAAKRTWDAIPLCHPIEGLGKVDVAIDLDPPAGGARADGRMPVQIEAGVRCRGPTGVEMEALHACSVAALTVYDMCKAADRGMVIEGLRVVEKGGGRSGDWREE